MHTLVLIRHGQSQWNQENRFTGWIDVDLSPVGIEEAHHAAKLLKEKNFTFDEAYTSTLIRAQNTLKVILQDLKLSPPITQAWQLNERHYGALQGLNKKETVEKYGEAQVHLWRRSFDTPPPLLSKEDPTHPRFDPQYQHLAPNEIPSGECLKDTVARVVPYFQDVIAPKIKAGKKILIAAHGNSLRSLVKHLDGISDTDIADLNIPTSVPLVYELDNHLKPIQHYYLGDAKALEAKIESVKNQSKK